MHSTRIDKIVMVAGLGLVSILLLKLSSLFLVNAAWLQVSRATVDPGRLGASIERAERLLRGASSLSGSTGTVQRKQALIHHLRGDHELATASWKAADVAPEELLIWAKRLRESGDLDTALTWLAYCIAVSPDHTEAYFWTGHIHNNMEEPRAAVSALEMAAQVSPNNRDIWYELGTAHRTLEEPELALQALRNGQRASESFGNYGASNVLYEIADINWRETVPPDPDTAFEMYGRALEIDDFPMQTWQKADAHYQRAIILSQREQGAGARAEYEAALALNPDAYAVRLSFARLLQRLGEPMSAITVLDEAIRAYPRRSEAMILAGDISSWVGDMEGAQTYYSMAVIISPDNQRLIDRLDDLKAQDEQRLEP